jgi:inorganic triphosphatase YgiF
MLKLAELDHLGPFEISGQRLERQRNAYFDTRAQSFGRARLAMRRRVIDGELLATWSLKAEGELFRGIATRPEIEVRLDQDMAPALVIGTLQQAARLRGAVALAEQVGDALAEGGLPLARPFIDLHAERLVRLLRSGEWECELALDTVHLPAQPDYVEWEIEVELKRGDEAALEAARAAIEALGAVSESHGTKLSRALDYVGRNAPSSR